MNESDAGCLDEDRIRDSVERGLQTTRRRFASPARASRPTQQVVVSYDLPHGGVIHVVPRRDVPVVAARAAFLGGLLSETEQSAGTSSFLSSIWTRGTRNRSASDFSRAVESLPLCQCE